MSLAVLWCTWWVYIYLCLLLAHSVATSSAINSGKSFCFAPSPWVVPIRLLPYVKYLRCAIDTSKVILGHWMSVNFFN
jgi:hypothetical protein